MPAWTIRPGSQPGVVKPRTPPADPALRQRGSQADLRQPLAKTSRPFSALWRALRRDRAPSSSYKPLISLRTKPGTAVAVARIQGNNHDPSIHPRVLFPQGLPALRGGLFYGLYLRSLDALNPVLRPTLPSALVADHEFPSHRVRHSSQKIFRLL